ncbi:MAG: hypothetical protein JNK05_08065 [Myxococcales bacterium]|nr:hypothetical protein [Myxococcales bacterium]
MNSKQAMLILCATSSACARSRASDLDAERQELRRRASEVQQRLEQVAAQTAGASQQCERETALRRQAAMRADVPALRQPPPANPVLLCGDEGTYRCFEDGALVDAVQPLREEQRVVHSGACAPHLHSLRADLAAVRSSAPEFVFSSFVVNPWLERAHAVLDRAQQAMPDAPPPLAVYSSRCTRTEVRRFRSDDGVARHSLDRFNCTVSVTYVDPRGVVLGRVSTTANASPAANVLSHNGAFASQIDAANDGVARRARTLGWEQIGRALASLRLGAAADRAIAAAPVETTRPSAATRPAERAPARPTPPASDMY